MLKTIAAISTPPGEAAIAIVRLSGTNAAVIAGQIFTPFISGTSLNDLAGYRGILGKVYEGDTPVDEVVAFVYRAPKSYTGEDVVELCCHGGEYAAGKILRLLFEAGAIPAGPGEFTKRAYLNGKLDLTEAEAVMDLIGASGRSAMRAALAAKDGALGKKIGGLTARLTDWSAHIAAWCDYPEEDLIPVDPAQLAKSLREILSDMDDLLRGYDKGKIIRQGASVAILGRPNVGKSTLMNLLTGQDSSIVTHLPGTTRDVVTERINIGGIALNLLDTAGIRETDNLVEQEGVNRALAQLERADIILAVFDRSQPLKEDDIRLIGLLKDANVIAIANKTDLPPAQSEEEISGRFNQVVGLSAATGDGCEALEQAVLTALNLTGEDPASPLIANERQRLCLQESARSTQEALSAVESAQTLDAVGVCLDFALEALLSLTGERVSEAVVEQVFARFCVGK
ncbi:MAG: tRNA uridine-5-carboxymethylaminomethyl(34) synthesis GTPase MnmE [Oscillospiraceae bacterium]|nr:tRNA uridine-5-carboxymethylaminomethyl(34) synthesis GTPase MnmE [Oscillospiraceae bacterium]